MKQNFQEHRPLLYFITLSALLMFFGATNLWAQPTPSTATKIYPFRFHNNMNGGNYYVVPTGNTENSKVKTSNSNVTGPDYYWYIIKNSDNTYSFIHLMSGYYLNYPSALCTTYNNDNRQNVSLSATSSSYSITANNGHYYIAPSCQSSYHMEPNGGNGNNLNFYNVDNRDEARWDFVTGQEIEFQNLLTDFSIAGDDEIVVPGTTQYTHNNSLYSGYFQFTLNSTTYYKTSLTAGATTTRPSGSTDGVTYTWSLEGINSSYATISNNGEITYINYVPTDQTATIKLTATHGETTKTVSKQVTFKAPEVDPTSVSATNMTVYVGKSQNAAVTLTPNPCYRHLEFASANTGIATVDNDGVVTGVSLGSTTVTVKAYKIGNTDYYSATFNVTVKDKVADPVVTFTPSGTDGATVSITCSTTDAQIYYTIDGSTPTTSSTLYESTFNVEDGATVKVLAVKDGELWDNSNIVSNTYHDIILATPEISIINGSVTFSSTDEGVSFFYTTNGSAPTTSSTRWNGSPITYGIANEATIKVIAARSDARNSAAASRQYIMASGVSTTTVTINEYEDHNWSYYKGLDYTITNPSGTTISYKDKYRYSIYSPDPRNVKITYNCGGVTDGTDVKVSNSEPQNQFIYYETLEKFVIGFFTQHQTDGDYDGTPANPNNTAEQYPYTVISNPFSVRPTTTSGGNKTYYGFAGWKIKDGGEYILNHNDGDVLALDEIIHFTNLDEGYTSNCTSAEVVFEATWTPATVHTSTETNAYSFSEGTYETNFVVSTTTNIGTVSPASPCTITAMYPDGSNNNSTARTITGLTVSTTGTTPATNTVKVEWIRHGDGIFNANGKNMILGRGITSSSGSGQGTVNCIRSNNPCVNIVKIESGYYNSMTPFYAGDGGGSSISIDTSKDVNSYIIFGCDYDKAQADYYVDDITTNAYNIKLRIASKMGWSGMAEVHRDPGVLYLRTLFKSGYFHGEYYTHRSSHKGQRFVTLEGGYFDDVITCGSETDEHQDNARSVTFRAKGNFRVDGRIAGGSTRNNCSGDRCMIFTGGRIRGWIAAGSNSNTEANGVVTGETFVYVGGNTQVNSRQFGANWEDLFNTSSGGVVYGSGCGINHNSQAGGVTKGSNVALADNAYVERGIYGGGAMGRISEGGVSNIFVLGGHVGTGQGKINDSANPEGEQDVTVAKTGVFGGACNVGGGYSNIYMNGGLVEGGVFGGSNINGSMDNNTKVEIVGGQVGTASLNANVHGGGYGNATRVLGSVNVTVGKPNATTGATIYGDVYGGSAEGKTNGNNSLTTGAVTNVTLNAGTINGSLYGGGLGTSANAADVFGPVTVTVNGGEVTNVFGGNNANGTPKSSVSVTVNKTNPTNTDSGNKVYAIQGVYGGGNLSNYAPSSSQAPVLVINNCASSIKDVYGGGNAAAVPATNVTINGGDIDRAFAGGNGESGVAANVNGNAALTVHGGTINQVFGGSNANGVISGTSSVTLTKSDPASECFDIKEVFAGGNEAPGKGGSITVGCGAKLGDVYGGANKADIGTSTTPANIKLDINGGNIDRVFGGNNASGNIYGTITVNINVTGDCNDVIGYVYGGGNQASYTAPESDKNCPKVNVIKGHVLHDVYGGGLGLKTDASKGTITGNPQVKIYSGKTDGEDNVKIGGNVFGGGNAGAVEGNTNVQVGVTP